MPDVFQTLERIASSHTLWLRCAIAAVAISFAAPSWGATISNVDTGLAGPEKYVLRVAGQPYFPIEIQVRLDKLRYWSAYQWTWAECDTLMGQVVADGFNTVTIPVHWYEVEPSKDSFDWTILDNYLSMVNKYNLKMEIIWEGTNSDGHVEWLGDQTTPVHLRTPDYVLFSPSYGSNATTSDYTIDTKFSHYTLSMVDPNLQARETYVLGQVMAHIASWDSANGSHHPLIGVQLNNEVNGGDFNSDSDVVSYLSGIGSAVKNSAYVVWTRTNIVDSTSEVTSRINFNESLRSGAGTNLDFIGRDDYSNSVTNIEAAMPQIGKNFPAIMENGGQNNFAPRVAALAGGTALNTYDMCGPDSGEGLYVQTTQGSCSPFSANTVNGIILDNKMLASDTADLALYAQGKSLYVHNWQRNSTATASGGSLGISYTPAITNDVGISIKRSSTHIVLMSTEGGTFELPSAIVISSASVGHFDASNTWVSQGNVSFSGNRITPGSFKTVLVTYTEN
jgi:hypothetical protein